MTPVVRNRGFETLVSERAFWSDRCGSILKTVVHSGAKIMGVFQFWHQPSGINRGPSWVPGEPDYVNHCQKAVTLYPYAFTWSTGIILQTAKTHPTRQLGGMGPDALCSQITGARQRDPFIKASRNPALFSLLSKKRTLHSSVSLSVFCPQSWTDEIFCRKGVVRPMWSCRWEGAGLHIERDDAADHFSSVTVADRGLGVSFPRSASPLCLPLSPFPSFLSALHKGESISQVHKVRQPPLCAKGDNGRPQRCSTRLQ